MNFIRYVSRLFVLIIVSVMSAFSDNGGSAYSRYWLGDINYFSTARALGMGGAGIAVMTPNSFDRLNPASWARINTTRYSIGLLYEGFSATDNSNSAFLSSAYFDGFMIAIPIAVQSGIVFGAGITPFSKVNYNVTIPSSPGIFDYNTKYLGTGGLSQAHLGISANLLSELSLGTKMNYYFGTLHHSVSQQFTGSQYANGTVDRATELKGVGFTFGATYTGLKKIFNLPETNGLNIGLVVTTTSNLTAIDQRYFTYTSGSLTTRDTTTAPESKMRMPYALGGGVSYMSERFLLAGDVYYQNWSNFEASGFNPAEIRDSYRFSGGCELLPKRDALAPFLQRLIYRFGFFYNETYYRIKGEPINEVGLTGGVGIPIFRETSLNIAAEYSLRGTTDQQLQRDKILRLSFTLSGGELWFIHTEEE